MAARLVWGILEDGSFVRVEDASNGLSCSAGCPECGEPLSARQGAKRDWHFAHASGAECATAPETALHRLAKNVLATGSIRLPEVLHNGRYGDFVLRESAEHAILSFRPEHPIHGVVLDALLSLETTAGPADLAAEIVVTHVCGAAKIAALRAGGLSAVEIDLSKVERDAPLEDVERLVRRDAPRSWAFFKGEAAAKKKGERLDEARRIELADARLKAWTDRKARMAKGTLWKDPNGTDPKFQSDPAFPAFLALAESGAFDGVEGAHVFRHPPRLIASILLREAVGWGRSHPNGYAFHPREPLFPARGLLGALYDPACDPAWTESGPGRIEERGEIGRGPLAVALDLFERMEPLGRFAPVKILSDDGSRLLTAYWVAAPDGGAEAVSKTVQAAFGPRPTAKARKYFSRLLRESLSVGGLKWISEVSDGTLTPDDAQKLLWKIQLLPGGGVKSVPGRDDINQQVLDMVRPRDAGAT